MKTSVLIPYKNGDEYRRRNLVGMLKHTLEHTDEDTEVVVCEQGTKTDLSEFNSGRFVHVHQPSPSARFNKPSCWNFGFKRTRGEIIVGLDADVIVPPNYLKSETISKLMAKHKLVYPFSSIIDMTNLETITIIKEPEMLSAIEEESQKNRLRSGTRCYGGVWYVKRGTYVEMGGYDERFVSWGGEDDTFAWIAVSKYTKDAMSREKGLIYHMWHPISNTKEYMESPEYEEMLRLKRSIMTAHNNQLNVDTYCRKRMYLNGLVGHEKPMV